MNAAAIRATVRVASRIVAISEFTREDLSELYPEAATKTIVVPNGLAPEWFDCPLKAVSSSSSRTQPYWVWYGQITPRKNVERLLRAYALLSRGHQDPSAVPDLVLIGKVVFGGKTIPRLIHELGLQGRVRMLQPLCLSELVDFVRQSRGVVFPSLYEGFGMPVVEGMAVGVPVLTSKITAMPEIAGGHAVLVDPYDVTSIARGMAELLERSLWSADRVAARCKWARRFTARRSAEAYAKLIEEVVGEDRRRRDAWLKSVS